MLAESASRGHSLYHTTKVDDWALKAMDDKWGLRGWGVGAGIEAEKGIASYHSTPPPGNQLAFRDVV